MRTRSVVLVVALACAALAAGTLFAVDRLTATAEHDEQECTAALQAEQATVRSTRDWTSKDIPGIGDYVEIHWLGARLGNACSRVPGPTDWQAEGVLRLRDTDTGPFTAWAAATVPPTVRDTLQPFVPEGVKWRHSPDFPQQVQGLMIDLFVDPERAAAWFSVATY